MLKDLDLSTGNTGAWKQGKLPSGEIIIKLAHYLDTSADYLLEGINVDELAPDERHLVDIYRSAPEKAKYKLLCDFEKTVQEETEKLIKMKFI